jgi:radical SAM protein with 4Fe4S-binding SPASM domain
MGTFSREPMHCKSGLPSEDAFYVAHGHTEVPQLVQWFVTSQCAMSCPHCLADGGTGHEAMSLRDAAGLIEQVAEMDVPEFVLTGGEPLAAPQLPEVIRLLRRHRVRWSLNTAIAPSSRLRKDIEKWPPSFVAVSVDGPPEVHDAFRGCAGAFDQAMQSIAYFRELIDGDVAAGTSVTRVNFPHLHTLTGIVVSSGATSWGLHLLIPEGRAAWRKDLFLSRQQLRYLLQFCAAKRNVLPVTIADEMGYCGHWEALIRDEPFYCGAGRAGCVVLHDGEVVPCTTQDRTTSAGNVRRQSLRELWLNGFAQQRGWSPRGRCLRCDYAAGCQGGCWLQRKNGTQCFRNVWDVPALTKTAAALVVGCAMASSEAPAAELPKALPAVTSIGQTTHELRPEIDESRMEILQRHIIQWYASRFGGRGPKLDTVRESLVKSLPDDPGARYVLEFIKGDRPDSLAERVKQINSALTTKQRSLCLVGLAWRDVTEWCMDGRPAVERTAEERKLLREVMKKLATTSDQWYAEIFKMRQDALLRRPQHYRHFFRSKAGPPQRVRFEDRIARERGMPSPYARRDLLANRYYGRLMVLPLRIPDGTGLRHVRGNEQAAESSLSVFDMLHVPQGDKRVIVGVGSAGRGIDVLLPAGAELTYGDVLRLAYEQYPEKLTKISKSSPRGPLSLPVLRAQVSQLKAKGADSATDLLRAQWHLIDLWLF